MRFMWNEYNVAEERKNGELAFFCLLYLMY